MDAKFSATTSGFCSSPELERQYQSCADSKPCSIASASVGRSCGGQGER